jgi:hypothetical protein
MGGQVAIVAATNIGTVPCRPVFESGVEAEPGWQALTPQPRLTDRIRAQRRGLTTFPVWVAVEWVDTFHADAGDQWSWAPSGRERAQTRAAAHARASRAGRLRTGTSSRPSHRARGDISASPTCHRFQR